jgi:hypothetical protein
MRCTPMASKELDFLRQALERWGALPKSVFEVLDTLDPDVRWYILDENNKPKRATIRQWSAWRESKPPNFRVGSTRKGKVWVSTVFLGLDHGHSSRKDAPPILFETMIFDMKPRAKNPRDRQKSRSYQTRCSTWDEALKMHEAGCAAAWEPKIV